MQRRHKKNCRLDKIVTTAIAVLIVISASPLLAGAQTAVTTYHYDNNRTGWNRTESVLTPTNVGSSSFGLLQTVDLMTRWTRSRW